MKNKELKRQIDALPAKMAALNEQIEAHLANVKRMPQGKDRWEAEEWIIAECHLDPKRVRTNPSWSSQDWLTKSMKLKVAAVHYRNAGKLAQAIACESDAKIAAERAAWMG